MTQAVGELVAALRSEVTEGGHVLLDRLEAELGLRLWPQQVFDVAVDVFGPALNNPKSRTRLSLDRRIGHAVEVWRVRYGPLNLKQEQYASSVLCNAIRAGQADKAECGPDANLTALVLARLTRVVNHEVVHAGFGRRRDEQPTHALASVLQDVA